MTSKDLGTLVMLILGLIWLAIVLVLIRRGKMKLEMWPPTLGIGTGIYAFAASMIDSIMLQPISEFVDYTMSNLLSALLFGLLGYIGGVIIVRNIQAKKR